MAKKSLDEGSLISDIYLDEDGETDDFYRANEYYKIIKLKDKVFVFSGIKLITVYHSKESKYRRTR